MMVSWFVGLGFPFEGAATIRYRWEFAGSVKVPKNRIPILASASYAAKKAGCASYRYYGIQLTCQTYAAFSSAGLCGRSQTLGKHGGWPVACDRPKART